MKRLLLVATLLPLASDWVTAQAGQPGLVEAEFIYQQAPIPQCHATTIAETSQGLVVAWFGGTREGHPDVGIWSARLERGKWTAPKQVAAGVQTDHSRHPCWNPVLFQAKGGPLMLFYKVGPNPQSWWGMLQTSGDGGKTWSARRRLPPGIFGPIKNKPLQLANGAILCPTSTEDQGWRVHFESTRDGGLTWQATKPVNDGREIAAIQPAILVHGDGRLQALSRSRQGRIAEVWSEDGGKSWGRMTLTSLPNPNSGIDAVTLRDGRQLLVYNHASQGRWPLNVALSQDGRNWQAGLVLENEANEYSYPAVIQTADGLVHVTYTWKRQRVKHVVVDPKALQLRPMSGLQWPN